MAILNWEFDMYLYIGLLYIPVYFLYVIFVIVTIISAFYTLFTKSWNKPVTAAWRAIVNITLLGRLKSEAAENGRKRYSLFDYPVTPGYVRAIGIFAIVLWISLLANFWMNSIIEVTEECRNGIDCFFAYNRSRIDRCCDVVNEVIQCYELQLDFIKGAETAGGLLAITVTILYGQLSAQAWLEKKKGTSKTKCKRVCFKALSILLGFIPLAVINLFSMLSAMKSVIKIFSGDYVIWSQCYPMFKNFFNLSPLLIISSYPLFKKTRLSTDPEAGSPGRDSYTRIEDHGHVSINEEQPLITRAHDTQ